MGKSKNKSYNKTKTSNGVNNDMKEKIQSAQHIGEELTGTVKWFNPKKGYGFIEAENGSEYFVHSSDIKEGREEQIVMNVTSLNKGDQVSFTVIEGQKGVQAGNLVDHTAADAVPSDDAE